MAAPPEKQGYYTRERIIFLALIAIIGFGLVLPFGFGGFEPPQAKEEAGRIAGAPVTRSDLAGVWRTSALLDGLDEIESQPQRRFMRRNNTLMDLFYRLRFMDRGLDADAREDRAWEWLAYLRAADRAGIRVAPQEVKDWLLEAAADPAGGFDAAVYARFVEGNLEMRVPDFEAAVARHLQVRKYFAAVGDAAVVSPEEILQTYLDENREVEIAWMGFAPEDFAASVKPPTRDAIYRYFEANRRSTTFRIPAKAQVEYLLAEAEKLEAEVEAPADADVATYYENNKAKFQKPAPAPAAGAGTPPPPEYRPLEEVKAEIVKEIRSQRSRRRAMQAAQKILIDDIGSWERARAAGNAEPLRFEAIAAARGVAHGVSHLFTENELGDVEKAFGEFVDQQTRDRENFRRRVFQEMKEGDVMPGQFAPVETSKGYLIYRLLKRKEGRVPQQFSAEIEAEIVRQLRRNALEVRARDEARAWLDTIQRLGGLEKAETERKMQFHRPSPLRPSGPLPQPGGGFLRDGRAILQRAFELRAENRTGTPVLLEADPEKGRDSHYVIVLLRALEAPMERFDLPAVRDSLRSRILDGGWNPLKGTQTPGRRRELIDAERERLRKTIERKKSPAEERRDVEA